MSHPSNQPSSAPTESSAAALSPAAADRQWFVMRDLKRRNAKLPAYTMLSQMGIEVFTPMVWRLATRQGQRRPERVPFMQDLLFVHDSRTKLDPIVSATDTLQYRFVKGGNGQPMTVRATDMQRFIRAVESTPNPRYYSPSEITPDMVGRKVRIVGGPLDGYHCHLQKLRGTRTRRIFVELPHMLTAAIEVTPEFIQLVDE